MTTVSAPPKIHLTFFPDYRATNPYQTLLYQGLQAEVSAAPGTVEEAIKASARSRGSECHIFHLHWEHQALSDPDMTVEDFLNQLSQFRDAGGIFIWTLHNLLPHESFELQDITDLYQGLALLADVILVHSLPAYAAAREMWNFAPEKVRIIPHSNYAGAYKRSKKEQARAALGLEDAGMVALLPGRIASYKCPEALVDSFAETAGSKDRLIIAGHFANGLVIDKKNDPRILLLEGFATDEEVSQYHAAADFVVLPYAQSLTSGSAILAATLGRGVLGPFSPGLQDAVQHGETGALYDPSDENGLRNALKDAFSSGPDVWMARGDAAMTAAQGRDAVITTNAWRDLIATVQRSSTRSQIINAQMKEDC